jgi:hypothetical protein
MKMSLKHTRKSKDTSLEKLLASLKNTLERGTDFALIIGFISSQFSETIWGLKYRVSKSTAPDLAFSQAIGKPRISSICYETKITIPPRAESNL